MYSVVMKGSLTATSSTSGLWRATRATSLPILPKPEHNHRRERAETHSDQSRFNRTETKRARTTSRSQKLTVDSDLNLACIPKIQPAKRKAEGNKSAKPSWLDRKWSRREQQQGLGGEIRGERVQLPMAKGAATTRDGMGSRCREVEDEKTAADMVRWGGGPRGRPYKAESD